MIDTTIHNPDNKAHFARIKPVGRRITIWRGDEVIGDSISALRLQETGRDVYDPVIYLPESDVKAALAPIDGKSTHSPLKGDAAYLALKGEEIAWTYDHPLPSAAMLAGHVAFYADKVTVEEIGAQA